MCTIVPSFSWRMALQLLFDIFDVDRRGKITMPELDAMLRMLYASEDADPKLLMLLGVNGSSDENALTFQEFLAVRRRNALVIHLGLTERYIAAAQRMGVQKSVPLTCIPFPTCEI